MPLTTVALLAAIFAAVFFLISFTFVYRSFYSMRIKVAEKHSAAPHAEIESV